MTEIGFVDECIKKVQESIGLPMSEVIDILLDIRLFLSEQEALVGSAMPSGL